MKLVSYFLPNQAEAKLGAIVGDNVIDLVEAEAWAVETDRLAALRLSHEAHDPILALLNTPDGIDQARALLKLLEKEDVRHLHLNFPLNQVRLRAPIGRPPSLRDFYAFEQHVKTARANRGAEMIPDWYDIAIFYFSNHNAIAGPYDSVKRPKASKSLDFELEVAAVIGRGGIDIPARNADEYIAGYMVMNDWSARDLQMKEMKMNLGPAKGKDFATTLGPNLVTPDELLDKKIDRGDQGSLYNLQMIGCVNGKETSRGNWKDMYFTFAQMIERASADVQLYPGDVIGSGTVGTGCLLELTKGQGPWLQPGDVVELEIEGLGLIKNQVRE
ncbi:MAG TPA: fumarylacetoacetate hydrolase family protein [Anaerolineae bacterium]|nr:fumarylacetoacetate hydrolase family protein [Anaerolineae bacterium]